MSSMRNAVQRRNHRERAQPHERQKWGILEKPKDYKLRAADHKVKKRKLKALQQKASERNEDEFYFGMMSGQSQGGVKVAKRGQENAGGGKVLSQDVVKLMKTQDVGYLRTMLQQTRRERERLEEEVTEGEVGVRLDLPASGGKRVVFEDQSEDTTGRRAPAKAVEDTNTNDDMFEDFESEDEVVDQQDLSPEEQEQHRVRIRSRRKLDALRSREADLSTALLEAEKNRAKMNANIGGVNAKGVNFKARQRKR